MASDIAASRAEHDQYGGEAVSPRSISCDMGFYTSRGCCYARSELDGLASALGLWIAMFGSSYSKAPYSVAKFYNE